MRSCVLLSLCGLIACAVASMLLIRPSLRPYDEGRLLVRHPPPSPSPSTFQAPHPSPSNSKVVRQCPDRYLYVGTKFGRHFNQLTSILAATVLATELNRTFVVPGFHQDGRRYAVEDLYTFTLHEGYCVVSEQEFLRRRFPPPAKILATCVAMRGVDEIPTNPSNRLACGARDFVKFKKNLSLVRSVCKKHAVAHVLHLPLVIYLAPQIATHCVWRFIAPSPPILAAMRAFQGLYLNGGGYGAVHLRALEGSCRDRMKEEGVVGNTQSPLAYDMCSDKAADVVTALGERKTFFMADDGQRPKYSRELKAMGGMTLNGTSGLLPLQAMLVEFWLLVDADVFLNNPLSTLSANVCRKRFVSLSQNKACALWMGPRLDPC